MSCCPSLIGSAFWLNRCTHNLPTKIIPNKICWLKFSGEFPMDMRIPPLQTKIPLESNPHNSRILVGNWPYSHSVARARQESASLARSICQRVRFYRSLSHPLARLSHLAVSRSCTSQGIGRQGVGSLCKRFLHFKRKPCRPTPSLVRSRWVPLRRDCSPTHPAEWPNLSLSNMYIYIYIHIFIHIQITYLYYYDMCICIYIYIHT